MFKRWLKRRDKDKRDDRKDRRIEKENRRKERRKQRHKGLLLIAIILIAGAVILGLLKFGFLF